MKDYIDIQERPSWAEMLPLVSTFIAMFGSTVLVPYLLKVDPATALFMNGIGTLLYLFVCKGKIPAYLGSSFAFIAPVAGVLSAGLGYEAAKGAFVVFGLSFCNFVCSRTLYLVRVGLINYSHQRQWVLS